MTRGGQNNTHKRLHILLTRIARFCRNPRWCLVVAECGTAANARVPEVSARTTLICTKGGCFPNRCCAQVTAIRAHAVKTPLGQGAIKGIKFEMNKNFLLVTASIVALGAAVPAFGADLAA